MSHAKLKALETAQRQLEAARVNLVKALGHANYWSDLEGDHPLLALDIAIHDTDHQLGIARKRWYAIKAR